MKAKSKTPKQRLTANSLRFLSPTKKAKFLENLSDLEALALLYDWSFWARDNQVSPDGNWVHWLILAGRGFGKTRTGAEWVRALVEAGQAARIALIAPTGADARQTMVEGESGLLSVCPPWDRPKYEPSNRRLVWKNGAIATLFSAGEPERLRGPQHDACWADELCAWKTPETVWANMLFGLRLGEKPKTCITTTPKPSAFIKGLMAADNSVVTTGTTFDNLDNLAPTFAEEILKTYEGTRIGRQELMAEILEDVPGALWSRDQLDGLRVQSVPELVRIVVAVDPPVSIGESADACGLVAVGIDESGTGYVMRDATTQGLSPLEWARRVVALYHDLSADCVVAEVNQGGALVETLLREIDTIIPIKSVHARRGKYLRAEPVAALYEQGRIRHVGVLSNLEDQMCAFTHSGFVGVKGSAKSPDRLDALVWAVTELMLVRATDPRVRQL